MTTQEMRQVLIDLLVKHGYGSLQLAKEIGIDIQALNRFIDGLCRTNKKTMLKIERFVRSKE
jgi:hypothetical protein